MRVEGGQPESSVLQRVMAHRVLWCIPVMALLVFLARPFNGGFYEYWINYDPEGPAQQHEWAYTTQIFESTSGVLCGQLLALLVGAVLPRRYRQAAALGVAVGLGMLLAGVTFLTGYPFIQGGVGHRVVLTSLDDPVLVRVLVHELAAYPLYAAAGVGLGVLRGGGLKFGTRRPLLWFLGVGWCVATLTGLIQDDAFDAPYWLLWTVPPIAAGAAIAMAGMSMDVWADSPVLVGDWGRGACTALLVSAAAYALVLNLLGGLAERRRRAARAAVAASEPAPGPDRPPLDGG